MTKPVLPFIEIMVTQACNLSCTGCTNYSDIVNSGYLTWEQGRAQLEPWLARVDIPDFGILGGEPLMNPRIREWIIGLRKLMPNTQIRFTTNGLLLEKHFDVVQLLADIGNCVFKVAVHRDDEKLEKVIQRILDSYDWQPVTEYGVDRLRTGNDFRFHVRRPDIFWKTFQGPYSDMRPHSSPPAESFAICCQQFCPLIYNGRFYKCSTSALLRDTLEKFNNPNIELWEPYLQDGIGPDCSDEELASYLNNFGKPAAVCAMCPTPKDTQSKLIHLENVTLKKPKK